MVQLADTPSPQSATLGLHPVAAKGRKLSTTVSSAVEVFHDDALCKSTLSIYLSEFA